MRELTFHNARKTSNDRCRSVFRTMACREVATAAEQRRDRLSAEPQRGPGMERQGVAPEIRAAPVPSRPAWAVGAILVAEGLALASPRPLPLREQRALCPIRNRASRAAEQDSRT